MRGPARAGANSSTSQAALFVVISCLASSYVVGRLWSSSAETAYLKEELEALSSLAHEQQLLLGSVQVGQDDPLEVIFYSIRPAPAGNIPPLSLQGPPLDSVMEQASQSEPLSGQVMAQVDTIDAGVVHGWACNLADAGKPLKVALYVDGIQVAETMASSPVALTSVATRSCHFDPRESGPWRVGFSVKLPALPQGKHELRVFVHFEDSEVKQEVYHSPLTFVESSIEPDAKETIRRKDAIIVRRNAELAALWEEVKTQVPWRRAEAAAEQQQADDGANSSDSRLLAVILVHTTSNDRVLRNALRATWTPSGKPQAEELLEKSKVAIRFIMGMPQGPEALQAEVEEFGDILLIEGEQTLVSAAKRLLGALHEVTRTLDADFYVVTHHTVVVSVPGVVAYLQQKRNQGNAYIGCMKSGEVVADEYSAWYEPETWRFGDREEEGPQYPRHARADFYAISRPVARYLARNRDVLHAYSHEDTSVGAWMLGLDIEMEDENKFCCAVNDCQKNDAGRQACAAFYDTSCGGVCEGVRALEYVYKTCVLGEKQKEEEGEKVEKSKGTKKAKGAGAGDEKS